MLYFIIRNAAEASNIPVAEPICVNESMKPQRCGLYVLQKVKLHRPIQQHSPVLAISE